MGIPLCDTMGRSEREAAAALLVLTCRENGDTWHAVKPEQMGAAMGASPQFEKLGGNPFWWPDFPDLVKAGFAESTLEKSALCAFTTKGLEALRKWVP